jgi:hypothetical protein
MTGEGVEERGVRVVAPAGLGALIRSLAKGIPKSKPDPAAWVKAPYEPLPALVEAARVLFERQPLPRIKRAESAQIPETVARMESIARESIAAGRKTLVLLTGVPGSGKTLVGLQLVHARGIGAPAIFLSGNGPLVQVLKYSLNSGEFVLDLHAFLNDYLVRNPGPPRERVIVFDEAQRAWDRDRVLAKRKGKMLGSEPSLLVNLCDQIQEGCVLVALMGEGQEIHAGEEAGIVQWVDAVRTSQGWQVVGPPHLASVFRRAGQAYDETPLFNLSLTLRSHRADSVALWSGLLLEGKFEQAAGVARDLSSAGFALWASRSIETCMTYVRDRYAGEGSKRYGIIASSKYRKLEADCGIRVARTPYWYYGEWFEAPPADSRSCCRMNLAVSEFGCQGLELDLPLLCWGPDLTWDGSRWAARFRKSPQIHDPQRLRINAYRVLLTRGRDGLVVFVPSELESTWEALLKAGFSSL